MDSTFCLLYKVAFYSVTIIIY